MYNTIKVMCMDIKKVDIKFCTKNELFSKSIENVSHIKVLPWLSVVQSYEGSYDIQLVRHSIKKTGDKGFFIAPSGIQQTITHHHDTRSNQMRCRWIFLDVVINDRYRLDSLYDFPTIVPETEKDELNLLFDKLFLTSDIFECYSLYYQILKLLIRLAKPKTTSTHETVRPALEYIEKNYMHKIRISDLAEQVHMSESNFYAVFRKNLEISPIAYINRYRISLAAELLQETDEKIIKIANTVGIEDPLYFNKMFHNMYQTSPRQYRKLYRNTTI